jgi:hypothetical protein
MAQKEITKGLWLKSEVASLRRLFPGNPTAQVAASWGDQPIR